MPEGKPEKKPEPEECKISCMIKVAQFLPPTVYCYKIQQRINLGDCIWMQTKEAKQKLALVTSKP